MLFPGSNDAAVEPQTVVENHIAVRDTVNVSCVHYGTCRKYIVAGAAIQLLTLLDFVMIAFAVVFQLPHLVGSAASTTTASKLDRWVLSLFYSSESASTPFSAITVMLLLAVASRVSFTWLASATAESVVAIKGVGLQLSSRVARGETVTKVVDVNTIECLCIHEGYYRHQVVYFIAVVVRDAPESIVLFAESLPRLAALKPILRGLRHVLYGEPEHGPSLADLEARYSSEISQSRPKDC